MNRTSESRFRARLLQSTALVVFVTSAVGAQAQTANTTGANINVLNLLSPFLGLNATAAGQATLQANLQQSIAINNAASLTLQQLAISDKNLPSFVSNPITGLSGTYGVAVNLAGGLPAQAAIGGITPQQPVGGLGTQLGAIYATGVAGGLGGPLANTVALLTKAYSFTGSDLGVAKNYFANGTINGTVTAVAPAGFTLPTFNGLPNKTDSVYDLGYGVSNTDVVNQNKFGDSRPAQVAKSQFNLFDPTALNGINTNPSFPSGHTNYAYTDSILIGMMVPELYQSMVLRASEYANSRIVLGVHYPLDIIASRAFASYDLAQALTNPSYINNPAMTGSALNLPSLLTQATAELRGYLATQCGDTVANCATGSANTAGNPYVASAANQALYQQRLTYGLPTLSFAQAPREAAPTGGPDASVLLAPVYGGSTATAKQLAPSGGLYGSLQTSTINQIIVNTESNALTAFYGTALSYWTRIDLYSAIGYFQNLTGTLTLANGDVVTTNVTVGNGGTLAGTGTVASTVVANGGTLAPGGAAGTSLTINGNLAFQSGATYLVQMSATAASFANVTGTAALAGTAQVSAASGSVKFGQSTILTSAGLNGSQFSGLVLPTGITGSLGYTPTAVTVNLTSSLGQISGATANQRALGGVLDTAFNGSGGTGGGLGAIFTGNVQQNLTQASGENAAGVQQGSFNAMTQFTTSLLDPSGAGRGDTGGGGGPFAYADDSDPGVSAYAATARKRSGAERDAYGLVTKAPPAPAYVPGWAVWAMGFGGTQTTQGDAVQGSSGTSSSLYGAAVGADYRIAPDTVAGFAVAGGGTAFTTNGGLGSGRSDLFQAGAFVRHTAGAAYLAGALAYGWQDVTTDRTVTIAGLDKLHASFSANTYSGRLEGGYRFVTPWMGITPYAAGQVTLLDLPAYAETALAGTNAFALGYAAKSVTDTRSELGLRADRSFAMTSGLLILRGRLAWAHDFDPSRAATATFQALPGAAFVVNGARQASDSALTTASAEVKWGNGWSMAATFEGEFSNVTSSYGGKGVVRYAW
ncbi:autotransporter domain-containing protein [Bradyrhizobium sp. 2TAF24]|uniref:autotransporter family protein n=1 Tax=Bradyrhizobium sp. 2TAF24 TaxID=3233011 RepID=UPI003F8FBF53